MADAAKNFDLALPNKTGDIPTGTKTPTERETEDEGRNPARDAYYKSVTNKNVWVTRLSKTATVFLVIACALFPLVVMLVVSVAGYYFSNLRDPLIRLEDKFGVVETSVMKNGQDIQALKDYLFPSPKTNH